VTWAEVIRQLEAAGFIEVRSGKGSHLLLKHPTTGSPTADLNRTSVIASGGVPAALIFQRSCEGETDRSEQSNRWG
jgi:predicted RNA binding protein YcfA (HicA-like mRNA interferase family)